MRPSALSSAQPHDHPLTAIADAMAQVVRGKDEAIELAVITLVAGGHLLIEDIPGVGKSTLAQALARSVGGVFRRIQFTSDLLPADLVGVNVWRPQAEAFEFRPGPLLANVVLADEINRAPPRTQSALLEAMGEHQITVDGTTHRLPDPFIVLATQNPEEHHGTYPLPESQLDRFLVRISMGYASPEVETALLQQGRPTTGLDELAPVIELPTIVDARTRARSIAVHPDLAGYAQRVVQATREHPQVRLGVSTRGALGWVAAARARALVHGRDLCTIDDLQELAVPALAHRMLVDASTGTEIAQDIMRELVGTIAVPV